MAVLVMGGAVFADGLWKDGVYTAEASAFARGWKDMVRIVVQNGYIVDAHFDAIPEGGGKYKYLSSVLGEYGMLQNGGAQSAWYEQADIAAAELVRVQDTAQLARVVSGADAVSGVTVTIAPHYVLAQRALQGARR